MLRKKLKKDRRLEIRLSSKELEKINYLVEIMGFDNRTQLILHLVGVAFLRMSFCPFCGGEIIEMTEQNGPKEGWFLCSKCGHDFDYS